MRKTRDIIVIGASAGGVEALKQLFSELPQELAAAIFVVLHVSPTYRSILPDILNRSGKVRVSHARHEEPIESGHAYVAPPDHPLRLNSTVMLLDRGPKENRARPAIDALFRSAAESYGPRVIGVLLSGMLDDGVAGLSEIGVRGGISVVQDPNEARFPEMPWNAMRYDAPDYSLKIDEIVRLLGQLVSEPHGQSSVIESSPAP